MTRYSATRYDCLSRRITYLGVGVIMFVCDSHAFMSLVVALATLIPNYDRRFIVARIDHRVYVWNAILSCYAPW